MHYFRNFVLEICILISDTEHVYLKPQVTKFKNKDSEVRAKHKSKTLEKKLFFTKALTLDPKP